MAQIDQFAPSRIAKLFAACKGKPALYSRAAERVAKLAESQAGYARRLWTLSHALTEQRHVALSILADDPGEARIHADIRDTYLRQLETGR